jgi:aspartate dehydrogenase
MTSVVRVGVAGLGAIGFRVASELDKGIEGFSFEAVCVRDAESARRKMALFRRPVEVSTAERLAERCEVVVDCAPADAYVGIAEPALRRGRSLLTVSAAAVIEHLDLVDLAREHNARIIVATGALLGLDAVRAAAEGTIHSVCMITRKPPRSLAGAPYLIANRITIDNLSTPLKVFEGTAREGARGFPANVNVAAALGLAGIGPDRTRLEIWADPTIDRNTHTIIVEADSARFQMTIENVPTENNPGTGRITALSVIAALRGLHAPLRVGT